MKMYILFISIFFSFNILGETYKLNSCADLRKMSIYPAANFFLNKNLNCNSFEMIEKFNGKFDGGNYTLEVFLKNGKKVNALFNEIEENSVIENVNFVISLSKHDSSVKKSCLGINNNGHIQNISMVCNIPINASTKEVAGFVYINDFDGKIRDIMVFENIVNAREAYGFSKYNYGVIENIHIIDETIIGENIVAGFVGLNYEVIKRVKFNANIISTKVDGTAEVGGFSFLNYGIVEVVLFNAKIQVELVNTIANVVSVGGFSTYNKGSVEDAEIFVGVSLYMDSFDRTDFLGQFYGDDLIISDSNKYDVNYTVFKEIYSDY